MECKSVVNAFKRINQNYINFLKKECEVYNTDFEDDFIRDNYGKAENISVDYAIMEKLYKRICFTSNF